MRRALGLGFALSLIAKVALATTIYLTSGTTWTVPQDFGPDNTIQVIGAGGTGNVRCGLSPQNIGGGGGAYAKIVGLSLIPGATYNVHFGGESGGNGVAGSPDGVWLGTSGTVYAESGWDGGDCGVSGAGGRAASSVGSTKFSGGNGGLELGGGAGTGEGGGAAGPHGAGGAAPGGGVGGTGDAGFGGAGGGPGQIAGGNGTEFDPSHGAGGGGGSDPATGGAVGGLYGGGGGYLAAGKGGLIVIIYTPRSRVSSGVF